MGMGQSQVTGSSDQPNTDYDYAVMILACNVVKQGACAIFFVIFIMQTLNCCHSLSVLSDH